MRGYTEGSVGLYSEQALVLVCKKGSSAREIKNFAKKIHSVVFEKIGIDIEQEVTSIK
jgi:UDP-N-acetylenolpyruvoylglucosamine reductase